MTRWAPPVRLRLIEGARAPEAGRPAVAPQIDDSELLRAVRSGEDWAAAAFCRRVQPQARKTVQRLIGGQDSEVNDLVQVSLIEMVETIDRFRGDCSLDTWTSTVTAHAVWKCIRRRRVERRIFEPGDAPTHDLAEPLENGTRIVTRDLLRRVRVHLAAMDQDRAMAFLLHDVCGFDLREAARITGVSVAAAQKRLVRGRSEIRQRLADDPDLAELLVRTAGTGDKP